MANSDSGMTDRLAAGKLLADWTLNAGGHGLFERADVRGPADGGHHSIYASTDLTRVLDGTNRIHGHQMALEIDRTGWQDLEPLGESIHTGSPTYDGDMASRLVLAETVDGQPPIMVVPPGTHGALLKDLDRHATDIARAYREGEIDTFRPLPLVSDAGRVPVSESMSLHDLPNVHFVLLRRRPVLRVIFARQHLPADSRWVSATRSRFGLAVCSDPTPGTFQFCLVWGWSAEPGDMLFVRE